MTDSTIALPALGGCQSFTAGGGDPDHLRGSLQFCHLVTLSLLPSPIVSHHVLHHSTRAKCKEPSSRDVTCSQSRLLKAEGTKPLVSLILALCSRGYCNFLTFESSGHLGPLLEPPHVFTHVHMNTPMQSAVVDSEASRAFGSEST